jgi:hypothetical protein
VDVLGHPGSAHPARARIAPMHGVGVATHRSVHRGAFAVKQVRYSPPCAA